MAGVTILLSLTVFLNLVAESMPTTSDAVPLIGTYDCQPTVTRIWQACFYSVCTYIHLHERNLACKSRKAHLRIVCHRPPRELIVAVNS
ncbi:hypothetical protein DBV15_03076 [Temnothorax longispinosus]|uniref:Neurotransmitter-gated ion-channel transmembrane domain-containing protein n=1 Tax=Temnothorax longispinosus TaxID=300112 RepID=A0A4S2KIG9_9HYME|nr:hypothetical protein DBV15_03076 [Temnothorax longispinosus]